MTHPSSATGSPDSGEHPIRSGFVAIIGRPNAGKSTLLNALLGEHLSIVTPKAQTTWAPVTGILSRDREQLVFVDTPGFLSDPADLLHDSLVAAVVRGAREADVILLLLDPTRPANDEARDAIRTVVEEAGTPVVVAVNKIDDASEERIAVEERWTVDALGGVLGASPPVRVSAATGDGLESLIETLILHLPDGPFLYPSDEIATAPVRFFVAELVREAIFERFRDEIPWSVLPKVESFHEADPERGRRTFIAINLHVERASQKGILIGEGGREIRELGRAARERIEAFLDEPVYLELRVKVLPRWRRKRGELLRMGLPVPDTRHAR